LFVFFFLSCASVLCNCNMKALVVLFAFLAVCFAQNFPGELASIDFEGILGAPLTAAIEAQASSAITTLDFINNLGFTTVAGKKKPTMVEFFYSKVDANGTSTFKMKLPFLLMLPIPYIEVRDVTVEFNVKLNSVQTTESSTAQDWNSKVSASWWGGYKMEASYSGQSTSSQSGETKKDYALDIRVNAGQADLPKGTARILDIFESIVRDGIPGKQNKREIDESMMIDERVPEAPMPPQLPVRSGRTIPRISPQHKVTNATRPIQLK